MQGAEAVGSRTAAEGLASRAGRPGGQWAGGPPSPGDAEGGEAACQD